MSTPNPPRLEKPDALIERIVEAIVRGGDPLRVILFGSRARGEVHAGSDIDLLVVMPDGTAQRQAMARLRCLLPPLDMDVDLLVATPSVLERHADNPGLVYREILRTGRTVYERASEYA